MTRTSTPTLSMSLRQLAADSYDDYRQALMRSAADRLDELHSMLCEALPHIDDFSGFKRRPTGDLAKRIRAEVSA